MLEQRNGKLSVNSERLMIDLVVQGLQEVYQKNPPKEALEASAKAIVTFFPYLKDTEALLGYVRINFLKYFSYGLIYFINNNILQFMTYFIS